MHKKILLCAALAACSTAASADLGAGLQVGSTGYGFDVAYQVMPLVSVRAGYSQYSYSKSFTETDIDYDADAKLSTPRLLADVSVGLGFRVTGGFYYSNSKVDLTGRPTNGTYNFNGTQYQASQIGSATGQVKSGNSLAPYLGVGYGSVSGAGIGFYADLGAYYMGSPTSTLNVSCGSALNAAQCSQLQSDVAAEKTKFDDKISKYKWYPVLSLGVTVGF
ncbi:MULTISPECIES: hypothetical protein [Uliginosibacterium]|uniref:Outer membrane protein beta-barrel domain-containing protein n=1 Tax=Uliginosibacterium aquaticum TaxID=2731212 RepID=A0ABX2IFK0_9RHOO|nr:MULTISPECIES: hypothetical protein [Uliginosibacterium]MDO6385063.1 hypothetical protein [Uliginosibacterium sp. 31-12]NSL55232.1 hypothetical protein [Uliginosibacterium aquaticum]PLK48744.1 hypothetical protein C0V76_11870 [Uliginosibacterium sp. TH139]